MSSHSAKESFKERGKAAETPTIFWNPPVLVVGSSITTLKVPVTVESPVESPLARGTTHSQDIKSSKSSVQIQRLLVENFCQAPVATQEVEEEQAGEEEVISEKENILEEEVEEEEAGEEKNRLEVESSDFVEEDDSESSHSSFYNQDQIAERKKQRKSGNYYEWL